MKKFLSTFVEYFKIVVCGIIVNITSLLPRNRKMIIFGAWFGQKYEDNSRALYEYVINNRKDIKAVWITANKDLLDKMKSLGYPVYLNTSWKAKFYALRAMYFISVVMYECRDAGFNLARYMGGVIIINLWHGVPLKKIAYDDVRHNQLMNTRRRRLIRFFERFPYRKTYHIATSPRIVEIYKSCFRSDNKHVLNLGQARNDYFYTQHENTIRKKYKGKKLILYMPTHRKEGKTLMNIYELLNLKAINDICERYNAVFLIKKHYFHSKEKTIGFEYNNIIEITQEKFNPQELLDASDVLVTDYSSCFIDFLLLDRPILFYCYDLEDYLANDRDMYFDYRSIAPGGICENKEVFCLVLEDILQGKDMFANKRKEVKNFFYSEENQCSVSKKQIDFILDL